MKEKVEFTKQETAEVIPGIENNKVNMQKIKIEISQMMIMTGVEVGEEMIWTIAEVGKIEITEAGREIIKN